MKQTPLYNKHLESNAKMVDFGGWNMPINYGSQIAEHNFVREDAGMFDVSHMGIIDISGDKSYNFLQKIFSNDINKINDNQAIYGLMLNDNAGVIDDLIIYQINQNNYRLVVNSATFDKDLSWINQHSKDYNLTIKVRYDLAMIAVQGPNAREKVYQAILGTEEFCQDLKYFHFAAVGSLFIARTGYTGEDGFEIILPQKAAEFTWQMLIDTGVKPCGLGARDTLRLEAGMSLYGNEMDENTQPDEAGLSWVVDISNPNRNFIGKDKLIKSDKTIKGLILESKGVLRAGQIVKTELGDGIITSGSFSPTMKKSIALARIPKNAKNCKVIIRNNEFNLTITKPQFVRNGKILT